MEDIDSYNPTISSVKSWPRFQSISHFPYSDAYWVLNFLPGYLGARPDMVIEGDGFFFNSCGLDLRDQGLGRAVKTLRNVRSAWVKERHVRLDGKKVVEYQ